MSINNISDKIVVRTLKHIKYGVLELTNHDNQKYVFDNIKKITQSNIIKNKIQNMQESYNRFHNIANYSLTIKNLYRETITSNYD